MLVQLRARIVFLAVICAAALIPLHASGPTDIPQASSVFASPDLPNPITTDRLTLCIAQATRAMQLDEREAPQIVVLQLSPAEARRLHMTRNVVMKNKDPQQAGRFYEVWLVGPNGLTDLALSVVTVLEMDNGIALSEKERADTVKRVVANLESTVDAKALQQSRTVSR